MALSGHIYLLKRQITKENMNALGTLNSFSKSVHKQCNRNHGSLGNVRDVMVKRISKFIILQGVSDIHSRNQETSASP